MGWVGRRTCSFPDTDSSPNTPKVDRLKNVPKAAGRPMRTARNEPVPYRPFR